MGTFIKRKTTTTYSPTHLKWLLKRPRLFQPKRQREATNLKLEHIHIGRVPHVVKQWLASSWRHLGHTHILILLFSSTVATMLHHLAANGPFSLEFVLVYASHMHADARSFSIRAMAKHHLSNCALKVTL